MPPVVAAQLQICGRKKSEILAVHFADHKLAADRAGHSVHWHLFGAALVIADQPVVHAVTVNSGEVVVFHAIMLGGSVEFHVEEVTRHDAAVGSEPFVIGIFIRPVLVEDFGGICPRAIACEDDGAVGGADVD